MPVLVIFLLFSIVFGIEGVSVPSLDECVIADLTRRNIIAPGDESERVGSDCDVKVYKEVAKFYDEIEMLIKTGAQIPPLENSDFVAHGNCIMRNLRHFNVSDLFLKSIAYQKLYKVHQKNDHSNNQRMSSQQNLLKYSLQVCEPRSINKQNVENLFKFYMRTTDLEAVCLLRHINENKSADEAYKFKEKIDLDGYSEENCTAIVRGFKRKYYNLLDRQRNFRMFGLNPTEAMMKCRESNDKSLIDNIMFITINQRLQLTTDENQAETNKFYEIARHSAKCFFQCLSKYD